jgi:hypothetical protein
VGDLDDDIRHGVDPWEYFEIQFWYKLNIIHSVHFISIFIVRQMYNLVTLIV